MNSAIAKKRKEKKTTNVRELINVAFRLKFPKKSAGTANILHAYAICITNAYIITAHEKLNRYIFNAHPRYRVGRDRW